MLKRLLLMIVVVAVTAPVLGGGAAPPTLVPKGVALAGIPIGGMSVEQAQAAVAPAFARPLRLVFGDHTWRVLPRDAALDQTKLVPLPKSGVPVEFARASG